METLIGEYEISLGGEPPALTILHLIRGNLAARFGGNEIAELRELLAVEQKRIRTLGSYQLIFGASGDMAVYHQNGQRNAYFNADQIAALRRFLGN
ncbi:hypothetical protein HC891_27570 [Candidatus Gracilibacteria bacterium]|nr:hypothetical protein [Candidatus Gracilibacteria bacterium]